jgi:pyrimidine operon attenuation protein/uracil phosphoribosyltransferase
MKNEKPLGARTCLYSTAQLDDVIGNMARQAAGLLTARAHITVVGILRRGAP